MWHQNRELILLTMTELDLFSELDQAMTTESDEHQRAEDSVAGEHVAEIVERQV